MFSQKVLRMHRSVVAIAGLVAAGMSLVATTRVQGQAAVQATAAMSAAVNRARGLIDAGEGVPARTLLDSMVAFSAAGSNDQAEALYWRAVLAERTTDAERDWKRMVVDVPLSPRVPDALLRLADLELLRGRPDAARGHLQRVKTDFSDSPQVAKAMVLIARSYFEERDVMHACETMNALRAVAVPDGELRLQAEEMQNRCAAAVAAAAAAASPTTSADASTGKSEPSRGEATKGGTKSETTKSESAKSEADAGRYSVQIAAYDTRAQADAVVKRLVKRGIKARVDGARKPYRVRVGRYETRAEATAALARLKKAGQKGFVAELEK